MDGGRYRWNIEARGVGPLAGKATYAGGGDTLHVAVAAENGQGKSFLARMFGLASGALALEDASRLVNDASAKGAFSFELADAATGSRSGFRVALERGKQPAVVPVGDALYHVFDADYVRRNLEASGYAPSGQIEGYIVGRSNIEASRERQELSQVLAEGKAVAAQLQAAIDAARDEVAGLKVRRNIKEFSLLDMDAIADMPPVLDCYAETLASFRALADLPEDTQPLPTLDAADIAFDAKGLVEALGQGFDRSELAQDFAAEVAAKGSFVKEGMALLAAGADACPFCGQELADAALAVVAGYEAYLSGREAALRERLQALDAQVTALPGAYARLLVRLDMLGAEFDERKGAFPECARMSLPEAPALERLEAAAARARAEVAEKLADPAAPRASGAVEALAAEVAQARAAAETANECIGALNAQLAGAKGVRTELSRDLCRQKALQLRAQLDGQLARRRELQVRYRQLAAEIRQKEAAGRRSRRDAVADVFEDLLARFFGGKYAFDRESFSLVFGERKMGDAAADVLSEGEKTLVAFCHYLASAATLLERDDDRARLVFVVDDPTTGLDARHMDAVALAIRDLPAIAGLPEPARYLVFTHDMRFLDLLRRLGAVHEALELDAGKLRAM